MAENYLVRPFYNASEFLDYIRLSRDDWWDETDPNPQKEPAWVFRGMANAEWNLLPTGLRSIDENSQSPREQERSRLFKRVKELLMPHCNDFYRTPNISFQENIRLLWNCFIYEGISEFINSVINSGYKLENTSRRKSIFASNYDFRYLKNARDLIRIVNETLCGLAQHHGIPTYLLDWTLNPLFAACFACESWLKGDNIVVWAFCEKKHELYCDSSHIDNGNKKNLSSSFSLHGLDPAILRPPPSSNQYLHAQQGVFTWVAGEYDEAVNTIDTPLHQIKWKGADEIVRDFSPIPLEQQFLQKITLSASEVPKLKELLYREGITRAALMPSLDNMALTVRSRW